MQIDGDTVRMARLREQLLRLGHVALHDVGAIGVRRGRHDRVVVAGYPEAEQRGIDDGLAVDHQLHGLSHPDVIEWRNIDEHSHGHRRAARGLGQRDIGIRFERPDRRGIHHQNDVGIARVRAQRRG